jgi:hypothetical protein
VDKRFCVSTSAQNEPWARFKLSDAPLQIQREQTGARFKFSENNLWRSATASASSSGAKDAGSSLNLKRALVSRTTLPQHSTINVDG